jgi:Uma2 family endonuclease
MHDSLIAEPIRLTYKDYCALPDDGRRYEILDGDLYMSPSPGWSHQYAVGALYTVLRQHVMKFRLGEVVVAPFDVILGKHNIVEPDIMFVSKRRLSIFTEKHIKGAPDLLVEVVSPSDPERDIRDKRNIYARCGVDHYWIVDPIDQTLIELSRKDQAYSVISELSRSAAFRPLLFPKLRFKLSSLWK